MIAIGLIAIGIIERILDCNIGKTDKKPTLSKVIVPTSSLYNVSKIVSDFL